MLIIKNNQSFIGSEPVPNPCEPVVPDLNLMFSLQFLYICIDLKKGVKADESYSGPQGAPLSHFWNMGVSV